MLDVARNAANKIAVAFRADDPHVSEGVEFYDVDATATSSTASRRTSEPCAARVTEARAP